MHRRRLVLILLVASSLLVLVGIALYAIAPMGVASFGWFAYAPLSGSVFVPGLGMPGERIAGLALSAVGLLGVGFGVGWLAATRRAAAGD